MIAGVMLASLTLAGCGLTDNKPSEETTTTVKVTTTVENTTTTERPTTTTERPTTTTTEYDVVSEMEKELGPEMTATILALGAAVCTDIELYGVDAAMNNAAAATVSENLTDQELDLVVSSLILGVSAVCPENMVLIDEWASY